MGAFALPTVTAHAESRATGPPRCGYWSQGPPAPGHAGTGVKGHRPPATRVLVCRKVSRTTKTLYNKLLLVGGVLLGAGLLTWFIVKLFVPWLAPAGPLLAIFVVVKILDNKQMLKDLKAIGKGYVGGAVVGKMLESLPSGWRVLHDLNLDGENVDHLVLGPAGAFSIEVQNYSGKVIATPKVLYNKGKKTRCSRPTGMAAVA